MAYGQAFACRVASMGIVSSIPRSTVTSDLRMDTVVGCRLSCCWHVATKYCPFSNKVTNRGFVLFVGCITSQQQASVSQGRICSDNFTCCHTDIQVADPTFYLTQSQYTDTGPTSPSADPITLGAWQGSHWSANF